MGIFCHSWLNIFSFEDTADDIRKAVIWVLKPIAETIGAI